MADNLQVTSINKSDRDNAHERITHIGGVSWGRAWKMTGDEAIAAIESGRLTFYVSTGGRTVKVIVAKSAAGHKYLKTENDGERPDNLLSLPECP
jgi:hypothetical protein